MKHSFATPIVTLLTTSLLFQLQISGIISADAVSFRIFQEKSYYFGSTFKLNWHKADAFCRSQSLFLVSINNQAQLDGIIDYLNKSGYFYTEKTLQLWTSGNDLGETNQFIWTATGERIVFDRWSAGEPNHAQKTDCTVEQCVVLKHSEPSRPGGANYSFSDKACQNEYFFMCESLDG